MPDELLKAVGVHHTPTSEKAWDGSQARKRLKEGQPASYYRRAFAWADPAGDPKTKSAYKFIHHEVAADGTIGAANLVACHTGIGVLNGARKGTTIPAADRQGVYNHLAAHLRDAGRTPPALLAADLVSGSEFSFESPAEFSDSASAGPRVKDVLFYSGAAVERYSWTGDQYMLRFRVDSDSVDLDRLKRGAPVIDAHQRGSIRHQIGVVEDAWIDGGQAFATLRFSERDDVTPIWRDVEAGIIRNVSMGVNIREVSDVTPPGEKLKQFLVTSWEPQEISLVMMPADRAAQMLEVLRSPAPVCFSAGQEECRRQLIRIRRARLRLASRPAPEGQI